MTLTPDEIRAAHAAACQYPHITPDMWQHAALIRIDSSEIITDDSTSRTLIETAPLCHTLTGTQHALPTYNITLPGKPALQDRLAIIGIGANCAPAVLLQKFQSAGIGGEIYLAQATLENHAIVHSAFIGAQGYMPATVLPHDYTQASVTVGFYTPAQAEALTATEPNYDLVHKADPLATRNIAHAPVLQQGALLYVSIWGGFSDNGSDPVLQAAIPQRSPLTAQPTLWTAQRAADINGYGSDMIKFLENIKPGQPHQQTRLRHSFALHPQNAIPASIKGQQVKQAGLYKQAEKIPGLPMLPRIKYL